MVVSIHGFHLEDRNTPGATTQWSPGVVQPTLTGQFTTSANCGIRKARTSLTIVTGTVTTSGSTVYSKIEFTGQISLGGSPSFTDCYFSGNFSGSDSGAIDARGSASTGALFDFCHFIPDTENYWTDNIIGHHYTIRRSVMQRGVDNAGVYNQHATNVNVHLEGNYMGFMAWFYPDHTGGHSDGTHCDNCQTQAGSGVTIIGNSIWGYVIDETGNASTQNPSGTNNGPYPYRQSGQICMIQWNSAGGAKTSNVSITDNWIYGGANGITVRDLLTNVTIQRNKWMDNGQKQDGTKANYIRTDDGQVINGITWHTGFNNESAGPDANVWGFSGTDNQGVSHSAGDLITGVIRVP